MIILLTIIGLVIASIAHHIHTSDKTLVWLSILSLLISFVIFGLLRKKELTLANLICGVLAAVIILGVGISLVALVIERKEHWAVPVVILAICLSLVLCLHPYRSRIWSLDQILTLEPHLEHGPELL